MIRNSNIQGLSIPHCGKALKATLFADNTTIYLAATDDFAELQHVLDTWCTAAKAHFNLKKTEIIPVGTPEYCTNVENTYRITGQWGNYPENVHMAADGEPVRILGAWLGNGVNESEIWAPKIEKILTVTNHWKNVTTTLNGKRHVVQMMVGGMSQFLTDVQRMPKSVMTRLNKLTRKYVWNNKHSPPVQFDCLLLPIEKGGLGMLDLESRNEAIDVMWLKTYLQMGPDRPLWTFIADDLFANQTKQERWWRLS
ncbi:hypothetical protein BC628DRAFT_1407977 [Trametes gibbosa]|nr:hypothetical protein BC628DRAFT_1407977 [Trametes gibbosa]